MFDLQFSFETDDYALRHLIDSLINYDVASFQFILDTLPDVNKTVIITTNYFDIDTCKVDALRINLYKGKATPLMVAAITGREGCIRPLLKAGATLDYAPNDGYVIKAITRLLGSDIHDTSSLKHLVKHYKGNFGTTHNHIALAETLIANAHLSNYIDDLVNENDRTTFGRHITALRKKSRETEKCIKKIAPFLSTQELITCLHDLMESPLDYAIEDFIEICDSPEVLNSLDAQGNTILIKLIRAEMFEQYGLSLAQHMIDLGVKISPLNKVGESALSLYEDKLSKSDMRFFPRFNDFLTVLKSKNEEEVLNATIKNEDHESDNHDGIMKF